MRDLVHGNNSLECATKWQLTSPTTDFAIDDEVTRRYRWHCANDMTALGACQWWRTDGRRPTQTSDDGMRILTSISRGSEDFPSTCSRLVGPSFPPGGACCSAFSGVSDFLDRPVAITDKRRSNGTGAWHQRAVACTRKETVHEKEPHVYVKARLVLVEWDRNGCHLQRARWVRGYYNDDGYDYRHTRLRWRHLH